MQVVGGRRPELPMDGSTVAGDSAANDSQPSHPLLADTPASLSALPELNAIIRACWQQRDHRRPTAAAVYSQLRDLAAKHGLLPAAVEG
jgi:hypothetical protein